MYYLQDLEALLLAIYLVVWYACTCSIDLCRLLQGDDPFPTNFHGNTIQLCGQMFVTSTVFSAGCTTPFLLLRQRLNQLLDGGSDFGMSSNPRATVSYC